MRAVVVIPARYGSSRYPGKPLVPILGKPLILWVAELSAAAVGRDATYIATDDARIARTVEEAGFAAVMTGPALTGTDRIAEAAESIEADVYLNVQGDEPLLDPADIRKVLAARQANPDAVINGYCPLGADEDPDDPNIPKMVMSGDGRLLYASRRAVPGVRDAGRAVPYHKQVCIYAFGGDDLRRFRGHGRKGRVEEFEDIEILRFLELGTPVRVVETTPGTAAVDVPGDVAVVERILGERGVRAPGARTPA